MRDRLFSLSLCLRAGTQCLRTGVYYLCSNHGRFLKYVAIPAIALALSWRPYLRT